MGREQIQEYFSEIETTKEHHGYFCSVGEALTIVIMGSMCGLQITSQIHQWASDRRVGAFLSEHFGIRAVPCYYWLLCLLKIIKPESLNRCFMKWVQSVKGKSGGGTISFDGKTIRATGTMDAYESPLHIISAQLAEAGMTLAQKTVDGKSNEIPAMRELLKIMDISGNMVVVDALSLLFPCGRVRSEYLRGIHGQSKKE
jgi:hypothetical protein